MAITDFHFRGLLLMANVLYIGAAWGEAAAWGEV